MRRLSSPRVRRFAFVGSFLAGVWFWSTATASSALEPALAPAQLSFMAAIAHATSLAGPLGISPLLSIAMFGSGAALGVWPVPHALHFVSSPLVWIPIALLGLFFKFGRSFKVTKPFVKTAAHFVETPGGVAFITVSTAALSVGATSQATTEAGFFGTGLLVFCAVSSLLAVIIFRSALDILIWLSPIPFVDMFFEIAKTVLSVVLVLLAIFAPTAALVLNAIILLATALLVRSTARLARRGLVMIWRMTVGRWMARPAAA